MAQEGAAAELAAVGRPDTRVVMAPEGGPHMKYTFACMAALAAGALIGTAAPSAAGDTVTLGGVGSLSSSLKDNASVWTLRDDVSPGEDDTLLVAAPAPRGGFSAGRGFSGMPRG